MENKVRKLLEESPFISFLNIELLNVDQQHARGRMPLKESYQNPYGSMHGGSLYSLADTIAGSLANMYGNAVTTVDGALHFLAPAMASQYVYCDAVCRRAGAHLIVVDVNLTDDQGKLLDCGSFTFFRTERKLTDVREDEKDVSD